MIYDCFTFFNELDLLEIRLNILKDVVDRFVLVEAGFTHAGKQKEFYYELNQARFSKFKDKIEYVKMEHFQPNENTPWGRENAQRNFISEGLKRCHAKDNDIILISDLDEIPRPEKIKEYAQKPGLKIFYQTYHSFYLNYLNVRNKKWGGTRMLSYADYKSAYDGLKTYYNEFLIPELNVNTTASKIRARKLPRSRGGTIGIKNGGWHFTNMGGQKSVLIKMSSFAHQEYNLGSEEEKYKKIEEKIQKGCGVFWNMRCFGEQINENYPVYIRDNTDKYSHLIFKVTPEYQHQIRFKKIWFSFIGELLKTAESLCPDCIHNYLHKLKLLFSRNSSVEH